MKALLKLLCLFQELHFDQGVLRRGIDKEGRQDHAANRIHDEFFKFQIG